MPQPSQQDPRQEPFDEPTPEVRRKKKYSKRTVFYIVAIIIGLCLFAAAVMEPVVAFLRNVISILSPLIIGAVIAYLCDPFFEFFEFRVFRRIKNVSVCRGLSLFCTVITAFAIVGLVAVMMIPQLYRSLTELFENSEQYLNNLLIWLQGIVDSLPFDTAWITISSPEELIAFIEDMFGSVENALTQVLDAMKEFVNAGNVAEGIWTILVDLFNAFKNFFLGLFIAFYILASKEKRKAQIKKFRRAVFSKKTDARIEEVVTLADSTFGGFIYGKIMDSLVIGILTFVMLTIFDVSPYNMLIATFVGVTNVIPVFGPFIGAIPSFFVVLISNPSKAFLFLVLILIIQQLDGNIIGPKILGDNTGVSSLCVIIAISICSALWGVVGMIIGVPIFAVVIELIKRMLESRLTAKGEPTDTTDYYDINAVADAEQDVYYEHSSLRYSYEHSRFKPHLDKLRLEAIDHLGRHVINNPDEAAATSDVPTRSDPDATPSSSASDSESESEPVSESDTNDV